VRFDIEEDTGARISGWVAPDHPSAVPALVVDLGGRQRVRVEATELRPDLKARGLHATGLCGFVIDRAACNDLRSGLPLTIFEERSNVLVYRRRPADCIPVRLLHLETQSVPVYPVHRELSPFFQMSYSSAETIGEDTLAGILGIGFTDSTLVSGALGYRRYEPHLRGSDMRRAILLCDPYRELAARILRYRDLAAGGSGASAGWRALGQERLVRAFEGVNPARPRSLGRALTRLADEDFLALANPTTRLLSVRGPGEFLDERHAEAALDSLASFDVIGFDDDLFSYLDALQALTGRRDLLRQRHPEPEDLVVAAHALSQTPSAEDLVRLDSLVMRLARDALARTV
jgi:hypothetical protein